MRYNIFNKAHLPLKTALISSCISITDAFTEAAFEPVSVKKIEDVLEIFKEQITYETLHVLPFIFEYEPSISTSYATEHENGIRLSKQLKDLVKTYHKEPRKNEKSKILKLINESFNEFVLFN